MSAQFAHEALLYAGDEAFLEGAMPFVREGLDAEEPTLLVLTAKKLDQVKDELNGDGELVFYADMTKVGVNPARIIPAWRRFVDAFGGDGSPVRGIGEPVFEGRTPDEVVECHRHEALLNLAFSEDTAFQLLCPYDTVALDDAVIEEAIRSHPAVLEDGVRRENVTYQGLAASSAPFSEPLPAPPASVQELEFDAGMLASLREVLTARALDAGLDEARTNDFVLAVNEVATNSVRHGGGTGILRVWMGTRWLVCEVEDSGVIDAPLAGREEPRGEQHNGRGLWIANQLCDLVQVRTYGTRSVVRLHMRRS